MQGFDWRQFPLDLLIERKESHRISVCIPARDEATTVGGVVRAIRTALMRPGCELVDELIVVDDRSVDATGERAARAGARVVRSEHDAIDAIDAIDEGKGGAMARGVRASSGDIVVFLDGDVENFDARFVTGLVGPLLVGPRTMLVKASYDRPLNSHGAGGGRVTELVARPLISLYFPELETIRQPLAGETATRRSVLDEVTLAPGYGVELALLIDVLGRYGREAIAQVDLGERMHRNRPLDQLVPQARDVLRAGLDRAGVPAR